MATAVGGGGGVVAGRNPDLRAVARSSIALLLFNLLDGLFTLAFLQLNLATEANPVMSLAYSGSPMAFMVTKLMMVNVGLAALPPNHRVKGARLAIHSAAVVYAG